ncbi:MAG TPA: hypothetical protein VKV27_06200 [Solirubrobacteraceae bacterium]|nr:hypothetical protein [Solirubrobacteraceae bacterium]
MVLLRTLTAGALALLGALSVATGAGAADAWLPHPAGAQWQYRWTDSVYNPSGTVENVVVQQQQGAAFSLAWADPADSPPAAGATSLVCPPGSDIGEMSFQDSNAGLINTNWNSCPPPPQEPILCPTTTCANSLSSVLYDVIWGSRAPVLSEPLLQGVTWTSTGGAANDVTSVSQYLGMELVKVPAFPDGVLAAVVRTQVVQAGALGDPYGSGIRTVWWVRGVGPVRVVFDHSGGSSAPVTDGELLSTNLRPAPNLPDQNWFPLELGLRGTYSWTNSRWMRTPEIERMTVAAVVNRSARITVRSVSGPMRVVGQYGFTARLDGITNLWGSSSAASLVRFPPLAHGRHFFTPLDLLVYGFNPVLPAYAQAGDRWGSGNPTDLRVYGVRGYTRIVGVRSVRVPAGRFRALELRSVLTQAGSRFGSGVRTVWLAPGRGLVKLVFRHRDGSVSVVQLIR